MINEEFATPAVSEAFNQVVMALAVGLLQRAPLDVASTGASLRAAVQAGASTPAARRPERVRVHAGMAVRPQH